MSPSILVFCVTNKVRFHGINKSLPCKCGAGECTVVWIQWVFWVGFDILEVPGLGAPSESCHCHANFPIVVGGAHCAVCSSLCEVEVEVIVPLHFPVENFVGVWCSIVFLEVLGVGKVLRHVVVVGGC